MEVMTPLRDFTPWCEGHLKKHLKQRGDENGNPEKWGPVPSMRALPVLDIETGRQAGEQKRRMRLFDSQAVERTFGLSHRGRCGCDGRGYPDTEDSEKCNTVLSIKQAQQTARPVIKAAGYRINKPAWAIPGFVDLFD